MFKSIKSKLVIWLLVIFSMVFTVLEVFLYYRLESLVIGITDGHLVTEIQTIGNLLAVEDTHGELEKELKELSQAASGEYAEKLSGHYYQIVSSDGEILSRSPSLGLAGTDLPIVPETVEPRYETVMGPVNVPIRLVSQSFAFSTGVLTVQAGDSLEDTYRLLKSFRKVVILAYPAVFALCGILVFAITGLSLRPINRFSAKIGQITEKNLDKRVEEDKIAAELKGLLSSFNTMLNRLQDSFARQKQFLSDASHELRTPTTIIKSYCDVTLSRERTADNYREVIRKIGDTVDRMCGIINRILVISRLDSKTTEFRPARLDLKDILEEVLKLIKPFAVSRGVKMELGCRSVIINGDRDGLIEVFTNIVENAIKYNKPDGSVYINVGEDKGRAEVSVEDTGIGIPEGETEKIFDRFYRVDTSRGQIVGTGLGLSIVRSIVEAHEGGVEVESESGKGSTFRVFLPKDYHSNIST